MQITPFLLLYTKVYASIHRIDEFLKKYFYITVKNSNPVPRCRSPPYPLSQNFRERRIPKMGKDYQIEIDGEMVDVSEDVYYAYKRPAWRERKRAKVRADKELSFEAFADSGFDIPSNEPLIEEIVADKTKSKGRWRLWIYLKKLRQT